MPDPVQFETEAQLCEAFAASVKADGWTIYPETAGWDMYLVRRKIHVGVQAKLWGIPEVLIQALPEKWNDRKGPHFRMVVVGGFRGRSVRNEHTKREQFNALAIGLRLVVAEAPEADSTMAWKRSWFHGQDWHAMNARSTGKYKFTRGLYDPPICWAYYRWRPSSLPWLPPFVPEMPAGVPSPTTVSPWMIASVRLARLAKARGWISIADARSVRDEVQGKWNPNTMLQRFYNCSAEHVEPGNRQYRWTLRADAEVEYPAVAAGLKD